MSRCDYCYGCTCPGDCSGARLAAKDAEIERLRAVIAQTESLVSQMRRDEANRVEQIKAHWSGEVERLRAEHDKACDERDDARERMGIALTKEEPKLLLIDEGDLYVAIWVQSGMVGQGADVEDALRDLLLSIKSRRVRDLETLRVGAPDERILALYNAGETYEVADDQLRTLFLAIEKEVERAIPVAASAIG